jgi:pimeloyl-ACP methyl ester carboxylesterase
MDGITHRFIETNGIRMHIAEQGSGPLVLLCHGFPELWYSWRHQLRALAEAGYHAVAPDMRGFGQTDRPAPVDQYTLLHSIGDMVGLLDALGEAQAVIAGHDWGAPIAWQAACLRPDRFRAVAGLSVPYNERGPARPTSLMPQTDDAVFYQLYLQTPDVPEAEMEHDLPRYLRGVLYSNSGDGPLRDRGPTERPDIGMVPRKGGLTSRMRSHMVVPTDLPPWLTEADLAYYTAEFTRTGFRGGLNWYRNIDRNWELFAAFAGAKIMVPALFIVGDRDLTLGFRGRSEAMENLAKIIPYLRETVILPGCGHWTQQECPDAVNAALIKFLNGL